MLDFSDAPRQGQPSASGEQRQFFSQDEVSDALAAKAYYWVKKLLPRGRIGETSEEWRCADRTGRPPRDRGSFVVNLFGDFAGSYTEFDNPETDKGGPIKTVAVVTGLSGKELFDYCVQLIHESGGHIEPEKQRKNGKANGYDKQSSNPTHLKEANNIWDHAVDITPESLAGTYFHHRHFRFFPSSIDVKFNDSVTDFDVKPPRGEPAIVARFRDPRTNEPTGGIHRIYLKHDGLGYQKKQMLGPTDGAVVMLAPVSGRQLGIGEGIETTLACMQPELFGVPGWAAASAGGMKAIAAAIDADPAAFRAGIDRLYVWADRGAAGEAAGRALANAAARAGAEALLCLPAGPDDFAEDLASGRGRGPVEHVTAGNVTIIPPGGSDDTAASSAAIEATINALTNASNIPEIMVAVRMIATNSASLGALEESRLIALIRTQTKTSKQVLDTALRESKRELHNPGLRGGPDRSYCSEFQLYENGDPKPIMANVTMALRGDEAFRGSIGYNEFTGMISSQRRFPWEPNSGAPCERPWTDEDEFALTEWIQKEIGISAPRTVVFDAVYRVAVENKYHPVLDYLESLSWDRKPRIDTWLSYYCGVEDSLLNRAIGGRFLIGMVARIFRPGCKMDDMLILEGEQGILKSTALRRLAEPWFTDEISEFGSKDAALQMRGVWLIEISELDSMGKVESTRIKSFLSRTKDRFRPPYGRQIVEQERQCVFAGTTNEFEYGKDHTGGRRYWPARSARIDIGALEHDRNQILAEAVTAFKAGAKWWIDEPELVGEQQRAIGDRYQVDSWETVIDGWLRHNAKTHTTLPELFADALQIADRSKWSRADQLRVSAILRRLGWLKGARPGTHSRERVYVRPEALV
jgi:putative DNA primase/helicase